MIHRHLPKVVRVALLARLARRVLPVHPVLPAPEARAVVPLQGMRAGAQLKAELRQVLALSKEAQQVWRAPAAT